MRGKKWAKNRRDQTVAKHSTYMCIVYDGMLRIAVAYLVLSRRLDILKSSLFAFVSVRSEGIDLEFRHGSYQKRALRGILPPIQSCKRFTLSRDMSIESQKFCFFQLAHFPG